MREIEIKLRAPNLTTIAEKLKNLGCIISEPKIQEDRNFVHKDDTTWFTESNGKWCYPRLRIQPNKPLTFTVKKPIKNEMDCLEYEVHIDNADEIKGMMELFGYIPGVTVKKSRRTCTYKEYTITLDDVERLGTFIEIERVVEDGDAEKIQEEMFTFAREMFGLEKDVQVMKGYDILMYFAERV